MSPSRVAKNRGAVCEQKLNKMHVQLLKNVKDLELNFDAKPLTAIMGANCSGKTTILHALACVYAPANAQEESHAFSEFFKPNTDSLWSDSRFSITCSYRIGKETRSPMLEYQKKDRWTPRQDSRPVRTVRYLGIKESVPEVESVNQKSMIRYLKTLREDENGRDVLDLASRILNMNYQELYEIDYEVSGKHSIAVTNDGVRYPALSMSSGEQRVFSVLKTVLAAPKNSLILVDEIDLFLHHDATEKLISELYAVCKKITINLSLRLTLRQLREWKIKYVSIL